MPTRLVAGLRRVVMWYFRLRNYPIFAAALVAIWIISTPARQAVAGWWFDVAILVALLALSWIFGLVILRLRAWYRRQILGPPAFGEAGGLEERVLRATFRAAPDLHLTFSPQDEEFLTRLHAVDVEITRIGLRHRFFNSRMRAGADEAAIEDEWTAAWERIQRHSIEGQSYERVIHDYPNALIFLPFWIVGSFAGTFLLDLYMTIMVWLAYRWATGAGTILPILEVTVLFSFVTALWVFVNRAYRASEIPIMIPPREVLTDIGVDNPALLSRADALRGHVLRPVDVRLGPRYFDELRSFFIRALALDVATRIFTIVTACGVALAAGLLFGHDDATVSNAYWRMILVLAVAPIGLLIGHYLASLIIQDVRKTVAPVLGGLVAAGVPLLGQYVLTGSVGDDPRAVTSALALGVFTVAATVLGEIVKARVEAKGITSPPLASR
jgi:hypothetical protein